MTLWQDFGTLKEFGPIWSSIETHNLLTFEKNLTIELFQVAWKQWWTFYIWCASHGLWDIILMIRLSIMKNNVFRCSWHKVASWKFGLQWISLFFHVVHVSHEPFFFKLATMFCLQLYKDCKLNFQLLSQSFSGIWLMSCGLRFFKCCLFTCNVVQHFITLLKTLTYSIESNHPNGSWVETLTWNILGGFNH
jgi:hypothetical protein